MIMPIETLKIFQNAGELEVLICGETSINQNSLEWTSVERLSELVGTAHGYNQKSKAFLMFLKYVTEIEPKER